MVVGCRGGPVRRGGGQGGGGGGEWRVEVTSEGKLYKENGRDTLQPVLSRLIMQQG